MTSFIGCDGSAVEGFDSEGESLWTLSVAVKQIALHPDGRFFAVTEADPARVIAYDDERTELWDVSVGAAVDFNNNPDVIDIDDNYAYVAVTGARVARLNLSDGTEDDDITLSGTRAVAVSAITDRIFVSTGSNVHAFDRSTLQELWTNGNGNNGLGMAAMSDGGCIVTRTNNAVRRFLGNGDSDWSVDPAGNDTRTVDVGPGDVMFVGARGGTSGGLIRLNPDTGATIWWEPGYSRGACVRVAPGLAVIARSNETRGFAATDFDGDELWITNRDGNQDSVVAHPGRYHAFPDAWEEEDPFDPANLQVAIDGTTAHLSHDPSPIFT